MTQVILFDIDGTLLSSGGGGKKAMEQAAEELFGLRDALDGVKMHGNTDPLIFAEILRRAGYRPDDPEAMDSLRKRYLELVPVYFREYGVRPLDGVFDGLRVLTQSGFIMGLVTGNMEETAWLKLRYADLEIFFEPHLGGFGTSSGDRRHILEDALASVQQRFSGTRDILLVGDTPFDVAAAHACGIPVCAVTTGPHGASELLSWGADAVVPSLSLLTPYLVRSLMAVRKIPSNHTWEKLHESH